MDISTETPSVETDLSTMETSEPQVSPEPGVVEQPQVAEEVFQPSYKYKAYGKEFEMDEWARPLLNKDTQPHLTKLFEKAGGFEPLKERYQHTEQELGQYKTAYSELDEARNRILDNIQKGDLGSAFKFLGVSNEQVREFVKQQLTYEALPPEQKRAIDEQNQLRQSQVLYQQQIQEQQRYAEEITMQKHELEIMHTFNSPQFAQLIGSYNSRMGNENAFRDAVDKIGAYEWTVNGRHISVPEATEQALRMLGINGSEVNNMVQQPVNNPAANMQQAPVKPQPKPIVVPNGSSSSPVKKRPMSIADLEREAQQLNA